MNIYTETTGLYGIQKSNRKPEEHWTKNCFNSSFPTALCCYMMDHDISATYMILKPDGTAKTKLMPSNISIRDLFRCSDGQAKDLSFEFESKFDPFQKYAYDDIDKIDLVVAKDNSQIAPIEIKLTVFPDNTTADLPQSQWGSEMVIRSATTQYCALQIYDTLKTAGVNYRDLFEHNCSIIEDWRNTAEMTLNFPNLKKDLDKFQMKYHGYQKPILMQVLWKTLGKSPLLSNDAFKVIVWSDFAFTKLMTDKCGCTVNMSRPMRASAKMAKCLWDLSKSGKISLVKIYRELSYGNQNDKEMSIPGQKWRSYFGDYPLEPFALNQDILHEVIDSDHIDSLSPERRLDQTLYFTYKK